MLTKKLKISLLILGIFLPVSYASAGVVLTAHRFAWSDNVGYINFENVIVNDSALSGYAWSANKGFINLSPSQSGVINDGTGNLSGSAWGEQLGYIDFDNVTINPTTGQFSGTASGALVGTITFDCPNFCDVNTDWRPFSPPSSPPPGGGSGFDGGSSGGSVANPPGVLFPETGQTDLSEDADMSARAREIDIQRDGIIDIFDFNVMMVNWGETDCGNSADMNDDCIVDILDFNILMVYWGVTYKL